MLQLCTIYACANGTLGLNLSRAPWDPYPWVSGVQEKSSAERGGVRMGDTLLELNGADVLGLRISELASRLQEHWQSGAEHVTMTMWRQQATNSLNEDSAEAAHAVQHGINQQSLQKFATCLQHISQLLECPVCLEVIKPPGWQCCNGHVLCNNCRSRSVKCPVCRVPLGPRGRCLLSDKLFTLLAESFPCDGGKTNKVTTAQGHAKLSSVNKCTNEYHNQPKMALAKSNSGQKKCGKQISRQLQLQLQGNGPTARLPGAVTENSNNHSETPVGRKGQEAALLIKVQHQYQENSREELEAEEEETLEESNNMLVKPKLKLSKKSWRITGQDQDGLRCNEVATINNGHQTTTTTTALPVGEQVNQNQYQEQRDFGSQNYHCPTGKSCSYQQKLANKLSTVGQKATTAEAAAARGAKSADGALSTGSHKQAPASGVNRDAADAADAADGVDAADAAGSGVSSINWQHREWQLLSHLSAEHRLAVVHFYGTFGQRLNVQPQQMGVACLRLSEEPLSKDLVEVHTFFLAVIEIGGDEAALFLWHLDRPGQNQKPLYETVIETECGGVKWFGPVQSLRRSWPEIRESGEFLRWRNSGLSPSTAFNVTVKSRSLLS